MDQETIPHRTDDPEEKHGQDAHISPPDAALLGASLAEPGMSQLGHNTLCVSLTHGSWNGGDESPTFELTVALLQEADWGCDATHENDAIVDLRLDTEIKSDANTPQRQEASKHAPRAKTSVRVRMLSCDTVNGCAHIRAPTPLVLLLCPMPHVLHVCKPSMRTPHPD